MSIVISYFSSNCLYSLSMSKQVTDKLLIVFIDSPMPSGSKDVVNSKTPVDFSKLEQYTRDLAIKVDAKRHVYYPNEIKEDDYWSRTHFIKYVQAEGDLGKRMNEAFVNGFKRGFGRVVCIGVCCDDMKPDDIQKAFELLNTKHAVIGPSDNGGYYLIGLSVPFEPIFEDKPWGTDTVFKKTYLELMMYNKSIGLLEEKQMGVNNEEHNSTKEL